MDLANPSFMSRTEQVQERRGFAIAGAAVYLLAAIGEAILLGLKLRPPGFSPTATFIIQGALCVLWVLCAIAVLQRPRKGLLGSVGRVLSFIGPSSMLGHGAVVRIGGAVIGIAYVAAAILLVFLTKRAWLGQNAASELQESTGEAPPSAAR